jgi:hypothetical protein
VADCAETIPQGLKSRSCCTACGTAEAVPFHNINLFGGFLTDHLESLSGLPWGSDQEPAMVIGIFGVISGRETFFRSREDAVSSEAFGFRNLEITSREERVFTHKI